MIGTHSIVYYGIPEIMGNRSYFAARFVFHFLSFIASSSFLSSGEIKKNYIFALEANKFKMLANHIFFFSSKMKTDLTKPLDQFRDSLLYSIEK